MVTKKSIIKRTVPILASALSLSALYGTAAMAGTNTVSSSDIRLGDTYTVSAGYYETDTVLQMPTVEELIKRGEVDLSNLLDGGAVNGIKSLFANSYADGNNEKINVTSQDQPYSLSDTEDTEINIGQGEQITLPFGYYFHNVIIRNSDKDMGLFKPSEIHLGDSFISGNGYYEGISVQIPTKEEIIERGEITIDDLIDNNAVQGVSETSLSFYGDGNNESNEVSPTGESKAYKLDADGTSYLDLGLEEQVTIPSGYYANDIVIKNSVANKGALSSSSEGDGYYTDINTYFEEHGVEKVFAAFYKNNVKTQSGTVYSAACSSTGASGNRWDSASDSKSGSQEIPLFTYDEDGNIEAILNVIHIYCTTEAWKNVSSCSSSASANYTLVTNTGKTISQGGSSVNINLFGTPGLDNATVLTLSGSGSCSTANNGFTHSEYDGYQRASANLSYSLEYVKID